MLAHKEENMNKKHSHMKAMLAKSFKKEKEWDKKQDEVKELRQFEKEDRMEKLEKVKQTKKALDSQFN